MSLLLAVAAVAVILFLTLRSHRGRRRDEEAAKDSTPALDGWITTALEGELAEHATGLRSPSLEERAKLARSLRGDPDPEVVSRIEDAVRTVELEFVRYAHEADAEVTLRVRYENGNDRAFVKRIAWSDVPTSVREDFDVRGGSRIFRSWVFPWSRMRAL